MADRQKYRKSGKFPLGGVPERTNGVVSKTTVRASGPQVRILPPPQQYMINFSKKSKKESENIKDIVKRLEGLENKVDGILDDLEDFKKEMRRVAQRVGVVRFNPFSGVGGDQSFSIALLDADYNGFVITSYYNHEANRIYAKPINNGKSEYQLSKEEEEAINKAKGSC